MMGMHVGPAVSRFRIQESRLCLWFLSLWHIRNFHTGLELGGPGPLSTCLALVRLPGCHQLEVPVQVAMSPQPGRFYRHDGHITLRIMRTMPSFQIPSVPVLRPEDARPSPGLLACGRLASTGVSEGSFPRGFQGLVFFEFVKFLYRPLPACPSDVLVC